jgi:tetratricopeptide (TPR) repeat protein
MPSASATRWQKVSAAERRKGNTRALAWLMAAAAQLAIAVAPARADPIGDCNQDKDRERCIRGCTAYIETSRDPNGLANAYHNRGVAHMQEGEVDRAIADYDKVVAILPHYADAYYNRGVAYSLKGDISRAIIEYGKAIKNNPRDYGAYRNRGDEYRSRSDYTRAIADYTRAIALKPNDASLYKKRGLAYAGHGDYAYALADATKAATLAWTTPTEPVRRSRPAAHPGDP